jgi:hypothetical protein
VKTKLDNLLESIDPARTIDQVSARIDDALNSFSAKSGIIKDWDEFRKLFSTFFRHLENHVLRIHTFRSPNPDIDWGHCCKHLKNKYGINGEKAAFEMVRTGTQGGFYKVLKEVAGQMKEEYAGNEISSRINHFWNALSVDEMIEAIEEYIEKYGHLLPSELTEGSAGRIKMNFPKVLKEHPRLIKRMRNVGRGTYK